jgi:hypothetical protein
MSDLSAKFRSRLKLNIPPAPHQSFLELGIIGGTSPAEMPSDHRPISGYRAAQKIAVVLPRHCSSGSTR